MKLPCRAGWLAVLLAACAPALRPNPGPIPAADRVVLPPAQPDTGPSTPESAAGPVAALQTSISPQEAFRLGLMPLAAAGVARFATAHPESDGRGVLIAILDSGIDPATPGLQTTSTGLSKLLDLRDFSGEGRVTLRPIVRRGDTLLVGGRRVVGASRIASITDREQYWGGLVDELRFGEAPAADLDGNGVIGDSFPVVVVRGGTGWVVFVDSQLNGTVADDRPVRDFAVARESFAWSAPTRVPTLSLAVNFADSAGAPVLDLFFDSSSHGTHVAGIAAGHDHYGVTGFDGVAPGARVIGLKIANDAQGAVTVTGSMVRALTYAVRYAKERRLPLVVNLSFGVGNEVEGRARIEARIDSILDANPDVVMMVASGNDGPGLSTVGFPGGAARVLSIGATDPGVFSGIGSDDPNAIDAVALFSSRGGELAAPDFVVPGTAYSSVPNFAAGEEQQSGTSMATPFASGMAARLLSAAVADGRTVPAASVAQALRTSARVPSGAAAVDAGAGIPDLEAAWSWLVAGNRVPVIDVGVGDLRARGALFLAAPSTGANAPPLTARVSFRQHDGTGSLPLRLESTASWVHPPPHVTMAKGHAEFLVKVDVAGMVPGVHSATIVAYAIDSTLGPLARIPVTVRIPMAASTRVASQFLRVDAGGVGRVIIPADSGRGMQVEVATATAESQVTVALHEPGGMPFRDGGMLPAGSGDGAALFDIPSNDVEGGWYELDLVAGPVAGSAATVTVRRAPVQLDATALDDSLRITARNLIAGQLSVRLRAGMVGAEQHFSIRRADDSAVRLVVAVPEWATRLQVDTRMPRDEWGRFTDFGVTFLDLGGNHLAASPLNYAFGRAASEIPDELRGDSIVVLLSPAFATTTGSSWQLDLNVRFYAEEVIGLDEGGRPPQSLAPGGVLEQRFRRAVWPLQLPAGFGPVIIVLAQEGEDSIWMREVALQGGTAP